MSNQPSVMPKKSPGMRIFAYGFDAAGFEIPQKTLSLENSNTAEFLSFKGEAKLDRAAGVIIPQGIFENITYDQAWDDSTYGKVRVEKDLLLECEKQTLNLLGDGKWICFLVGTVTDKIPAGSWQKREITDTDLCKKFLNHCGVRRQSIGGATFVQAKANEFISYIRDYGVAKTVMEVSASAANYDEMRVIAEVANHIAGLEFYGKVFFLPFHTTVRDAACAEAVVKTVAQAIIDYRKKRLKELPPWLDEFQFKSEEKLRSEIDALLNHTNELQSQLQRWKGYKAILNTSGDLLKREVIKVLENFFGVKIDPTDQSREDAKILDDQGGVLAMVEIKGTTKGIKREYINQVDSHRERNGLPLSMPGVLLINNEMSIEGITQRLATTVADEQIRHAQNFNVLIVRTVDLLFLMKYLENEPARKNKLLSLLSSGGGWLRADSEGYELIRVPKP